MKHVIYALVKFLNKPRKRSIKKTGNSTPGNQNQKEANKEALWPEVKDKGSTQTLARSFYLNRILTYYKTKLRWKRTSRFGTV
jgi:hypothetical protein